MMLELAATLYVIEKSITIIAVVVAVIFIVYLSIKGKNQ